MVRGRANEFDAMVFADVHKCGVLREETITLSSKCRDAFSRHGIAQGTAGHCSVYASECTARHCLVEHACDSMNFQAADRVLHSAHRMNGVCAPADCCSNDVGDVEVRCHARGLANADSLISKLQWQQYLSIFTSLFILTVV